VDELPDIVDRLEGNFSLLQIVVHLALSIIRELDKEPGLCFYSCHFPIRNNIEIAVKAIFPASFPGEIVLILFEHFPHAFKEADLTTIQ
jgi:hypothetical protein